MLTFENTYLRARFIHVYTMNSKLYNMVRNICLKSGIEHRLVQFSNGSVLLYDCPHWPPTASSYLHIHASNILISVYSCSSSLSGYVLVFEEQNATNVVRNLKLSFVAIILYFIFFVWFNLLDRASTFFSNVI